MCVQQHNKPGRGGCKPTFANNYCEAHCFVIFWHFIYLADLIKNAFLQSLDSNLEYLHQVLHSPLNIKVIKSHDKHSMFD